MPTPKPKQEQQYSEAETIKRRDDAIKRALNTPPKPYKDSRIGKSANVPASSKKNGA